MAEAAPPPGTPLLELRGASKRFVRRLDLAARVAALAGARMREGSVRAVDRVDLAIREGEVLALVGESGCGKSTLGRLAVGLLPLSSGERYWRGTRCTDADDAAARERRLRMQMIFQDPFGALSPRLTVLDIVGEAPVAHGLIAPRQQVEYVALQLNRVGLDPTLMRRFPHQFSGAQRARIGIARALAVKPELLVCDEPTAALDVSIRAQILNLFMDLRHALDLTYLFITRDPRVARHVSDRVVVMYAGRIVESGPVAEIFGAPSHPYTQALLAEAGDVHPGKGGFAPACGEVGSPLAPPSGCHFHPHCSYAMEVCKARAPTLRAIAPGRWSACHLNEAEP